MNNQEDSVEDESTQSKLRDSRPKCGIVMPISSCDNCTDLHWREVQTIISDAVEEVGFAASLVSDAVDVGIIHRRIIQNLYENPIVVCDVSATNPNVMFELGMRLAFDKPTIIVKDDKTSYSFDTSPIEHLEYPRDLRFTRIVEFKNKLGEKVKATMSQAENDPNFTTFLKHFGEFSIACLETTEMSKEDLIFEELQELRRLINRLYEREAFRYAGEGLSRTIKDYEYLGEIESSRRKKLQSVIDPIIFKYIDENQSQHREVTNEQLEKTIINELISLPRIRQLSDNPLEIRDIVHNSLIRMIK